MSQNGIRKLHSRILYNSKIGSDPVGRSDSRVLQYYVRTKIFYALEMITYRNDLISRNQILTQKKV